MKVDWQDRIKPCTLCSEKRAALWLEQVSVTGLVIVDRYHRFNDFACPTHAHAIHEEFQRNTIRRGWWSLLGIGRAPSALLDNNLYYSRYLKTLSKAKSMYPELFD